MNKTKNISIIILLLIFSSQVLKSQVQMDFQLWTNLSLSKDVKDFEFSLEEELRFFQNIGSIEQFYSDFGITYELNKHFDFSTNYRFKTNHTYIEQLENSHRFNIDVKYNFEINRFDCYYKIRFQTEVNNFLHVPSTDFFDNALRNKIKFKYDIKGSKLEPFAEFETFTDISNLNYIELSKMRFTLGLGSEKNKFKGFSAFYRLEKTFSKLINKNDYIIGISYAFEL